MSLAIWAALDNPAGLGSLIIFTALLLPIYKSLSLPIQIDNELRVGKAHIEIKYLGEVTPLTGAEFKAAQVKDARAYLATRFWLNEGIKVELKDPRDPTPYWLISCRDGEIIKRNLYKLQ